MKRREDLLFSQAAKHWLEVKAADWQPATRSAEKYNVHHLLPHFGRRLLTDIAPDDIARFKARRLEDGAAAKTINNEIAALRSVMRRHRLWGAIQPDVRPLPTRAEIGRALTRDEVTALLEAAQESRIRSLYAAILVSLHTGLRNKELRMLQWRLVNLLDGQLTVGASKTKAGEGRVVPLSAQALAVLRDWRATFPDAKPGHYVFPSEKVGLAGEDGYLHGRSVAYDIDPAKPIGSWKVAFRGALKRAGFHCRWHDLRHTFISRCGEAGAPEQTLLALAGHVSRKMLETYSHTRMEAKRRVIASFDFVDEEPDPNGVGTKLGTVQ